MVERVGGRSRHTTRGCSKLRTLTPRQPARSVRLSGTPRTRYVSQSYLAGRTSWGAPRLWGTPTLAPHDPPPQDAGGRWADGQRPPCSSRPAEAPAEATARLAGRPPHPMGSCRCHRPPPGHESSATTKTKQVKGLIHYHPITPPPHPTTQVPRSTTTLSRLTTQPPTPSPNHPAVLPHYLIIPTLPTLPPHHPTNLHLNPPPPPPPHPIPTKHPTPPHHPTIISIH